MAALKPKTKTKKAKRYAWIQPVCNECWAGLKLKTGRQDTSNEFIHSPCCFCNKVVSDISPDVYFLIRINPGTVPYPTVEKEE